MKYFSKTSLFSQWFHFDRFRNADISYTIDDFLSEIEHLNDKIEQREKQIQENSFKVTQSSNEKKPVSARFLVPFINPWQTDEYVGYIRWITMEFQTNDQSSVA